METHLAEMVVSYVESKEETVRRIVRDELEKKREEDIWREDDVDYIADLEVDIDDFKDIRPCVSVDPEGFTRPGFLGSLCGAFDYLKRGLRVDYSRCCVMLTKVVQMQQEEIEVLKEKIAKLELRAHDSGP